MCEICRGSGLSHSCPVCSPDVIKITCPVCDGEGKLFYLHDDNGDVEITKDDYDLIPFGTYEETCYKCEGTGEIEEIRE